MSKSNRKLLTFVIVFWVLTLLVPTVTLASGQSVPCSEGDPCAVVCTQETHWMFGVCGAIGTGYCYAHHIGPTCHWN